MLIITQAHRNDVLQTMTSFIPIEKVCFSKRLTNIEQHSNKVVLHFADGDTAEASILVGADGIKSVVRKHVLSPTYPSQVDPVYAGSYCYRGVIPIAEGQEIFGDLTNVAKMYLGEKRCCVHYLISGGEVCPTCLVDQPHDPVTLTYFSSENPGTQLPPLRSGQQALGAVQRSHPKSDLRDNDVRLQ